MYSDGPPHMAEQKQDDQLEHTSSSYVRIRDVALKTCQKRWMIGRSGKRGSGISMLAAQHDDDDDDFTPRWLASAMPCPKKVPKEIYKKKRQKQIRDENISSILSFIYWVQQQFRGWGSFSWIHWNGWIP